MPILDVDKARTVMVIQAQHGVGFAGMENELYYMDKTRGWMLFGDAKSFVRRDRQELRPTTIAWRKRRAAMPNSGRRRVRLFSG